MESTRTATWRTAGLAVVVALGAMLAVTAPNPAGAVTATTETVVGTATIAVAAVGNSHARKRAEVRRSAGEVDL